MTRQPRLPPESFRELLQKNIGQQIYLNADDRHPCRLLEVQTDYIVLTSRGQANQPHQTYTVPISSILSLQHLEGLGALVVYLLR